MGIFSFFKKDKDKEKVESQEEFHSIQINAENCQGCGRCVSVCPNNAYELIEGKSSLKENFTCRDCKVCLAACSNDAITFVN